MCSGNCRLTDRRACVKSQSAGPAAACSALDCDSLLDAGSLTSGHAPPSCAATCGACPCRLCMAWPSAPRPLSPGDISTVAHSIATCRHAVASGQPHLLGQSTRFMLPQFRCLCLTCLLALAPLWLHQSIKRRHSVGETLLCLNTVISPYSISLLLSRHVLTTPF